jgi:hypothetical protein
MTIFGKPGRIWSLPGETSGGKKLKEIYRVLDVNNKDECNRSELLLW